MADGDARMNLAALRRVDPYITEIVENATQVALYKYNSQSNEWEKTEVEGTLFVYARSGDPHHGFLVMNRLNRENLVEPITKDLEVQVKPPFLLYRNAQLSIYGIWFYDESECSRVAKKVESLIYLDKNKSKAKPERVPINSNMDIISLLTKAHGDYEQKKTGPAEPPSVNGTLVGSSSDVVRPLPLRVGPNMSPSIKQTMHNGNSLATSLSVADFFGTPTPVGQLLALLCSTSKKRKPEYFNKINSICHLCLFGRAALPHAHAMRMDSASFPTPGGLPYTPAKSKAVLQTPKADLLAAPLPMTPPRSVEHASTVPLMSPMMFAPTQSQNREPAAASICKAVSPDLRSAPLFPATPKARAPLQPERLEEIGNMTPLTRGQLLQAFNYLLKNDAAFVTQLHEAYVKSLSQSLKPGSS
nr:EOG090X07B6 [Lepidurus arcticus]